MTRRSHSEPSPPSPENPNVRKRPGRKPRPIVEFPPADPAPWADPDGFPEALALQMARHGETAYALTRALHAQGHMIDHPTLR